MVNSTLVLTTASFSLMDLWTSRVASWADANVMMKARRQKAMANKLFLIILLSIVVVVVGRWQNFLIVFSCVVPRCCVGWRSLSRLMMTLLGKLLVLNIRHSNSPTTSVMMCHLFSIGLLQLQNITRTRFQPNDEEDWIQISVLDGEGVMNQVTVHIVKHLFQDFPSQMIRET